MIYLASKSPRRRDLLKAAGIRHRTVRSDYIETAEGAVRPSALVRRHALGKALGALPYVRGAGLIVAADTIVYHQGRILGKPASMRSAVRMLGSLQGRWHTVYTGVCVLHVKEGREQRRQRRLWVQTTRVYIRPMDPARIRAYFNRIDPLDKAGAYAIQSRCVRAVERYRGCHANAAGLPHRVVRLLRRLQSKSCGASPVKSPSGELDKVRDNRT